MKKAISALLLLVLALSIFTGCGSAKTNFSEMKDVFTELGDKYTKAVEVCVSAKVYEQEEFTVKFDEWKKDVIACGETVEKQATLTEEEINAVIAKMKTLITQLNEVIEEYKTGGNTETSES